MNFWIYGIFSALTQRVTLTTLKFQANALSGQVVKNYHYHNMATLEQDLKKQILGRSKAEKVFRPWWDTLEDYLLNCLVLLGESICKCHDVGRSSTKEIWTLNESHFYGNFHVIINELYSKVNILWQRFSWFIFAWKVRITTCVEAPKCWMDLA